MNNKISMQELLPFIEEALNNNKTFTIPITGTSMLPLLVEGRDTVTIKNLKQNFAATFDACKKNVVERDDISMRAFRNIKLKNLEVLLKNV